ncbi:hypothetical protein PS645_03365 [Pseudomonas fluorescens]|uniref:Uncharacterized protein n=1 Tax=Pseudomonas fluorescens TaxID=294 RepID=A0A5E6UA44_PSEFL|nr:hypothetical protein PS645_03365 [Pseudomonas fluorescens]
MNSKAILSQAKSAGFSPQRAAKRKTISGP